MAVRVRIAFVFVAITLPLIHGTMISSSFPTLNGWRPLSISEVENPGNNYFNNIKGDERPDVKDEHTKAIQLIDSKEPLHGEDDSLSNPGIFEKEYKDNNININNVTENSLIVRHTYRKRKDLSSDDIIKNKEINEKDLEDLIIQEDRIDRVFYPAQISYNSGYEVTENVEEIDKADKQPTANNQRYFYEALKTKDVNKNKLTDNLKEILTKYNIKPNEKSANYELSRHPKILSQPREPKFVLVPIPLSLFNRYNNQLKSKPLVAVLLYPKGVGPEGHFEYLHGSHTLGTYRPLSDTDSIS